METLYKGRRFDIILKGNDFSLTSENGRHYCDDNYCEYCEGSTQDNDAHEYNCSFPLSDFTDDLGNKWCYIGAYAYDNSPSFGWWHESHHWKLRKGGKKSGGLNTAEPLQLAKIRRRIEDRLRKLNEEDVIVKLAINLGVSLD